MMSEETKKKISAALKGRKYITFTVKAKKKEKRVVPAYFKKTS